MSSETWAIDEHGNKIPGTGRKFIPAERCPENDDLFSGRCVGVAGHKGEHWRYDSLGRYCTWRNDCEDDMDIAASQCPDGHPAYVRPKDTWDKSYIGASRWEEIDEDDSANP